MVVAKIVIDSHLNDARIEDSFNVETAKLRRDFVDFLKRRYPGCETDWNVRIDPHVEWDLFCSEDEEVVNKGGENC